MKFSLKEFFVQNEALPATQFTRSPQWWEDWPDVAYEYAMSKGLSDEQASMLISGGELDQAREEGEIPEDAVDRVLGIKEDRLHEYEDPTSSKHNDDDSKWAGPNSDKERMPHEEPQDGSQENSSDAWEETRENGPKSSSQKSSGGGAELKKFFGGSPYPKSSHEGTGKSSHESEKMSEGGKGSGRKKGSKNKPRSEWGGPPDKPAAQPHQGEIPDELPDEWVDDQPAFGQPPKPPEGGAAPGGEEPEIDWASLDDDEFTDTLAGSDKGPEVKTQMAPPKMKDTISTQPQKPYQSFDPDKFDLNPERDPPGDPFSDDNKNVQTWDEFRAAAPREAAKMETEFAPEELQNAKISKDQLRRVIMSTTSGKRFMWSKGHNGWDPMDDGNAPTGDF